MKFDIHTHHLTKNNERNSVLNIFWNELVQIPENQLFSISVHPYYLNDFNQKDFFDKIEKIIDIQNFVAIGECGLDKNTSFSLEFQISILNQMYILAEHLKKPLIIHCVGYYNELFEWKKNKESVPMLLHGFVKKIDLLNKLVKSGFYVSFGAAMNQNRPKLHEAFKSVPLERLFLETDDQTLVDIENIYKIAAEIKKIDIFEMEETIDKNRTKFFNFKK